MKPASDYFPLSMNSISGAAIQHRHPHYSFEKHLHSRLVVYVIRSGKCFMDIADKTVCCTAGDFIMLFPHVVHSFYLSDDQECTFYHIHFSPKLFSRITLTPDSETPVNLIHTLIFHYYPFVMRDAGDEITEIVSSIIRLYNTDAPHTEADINILLLRLLMLIFHSCEEDSCGIARPEVKGQYVSFTLDYIEKKYTEKILIQDIADKLHISVRYLGKIFSHYMNMSLGNYINVYRINRAIDLMEDSSLTLTEIAGKIGLKDSQHFSKLFQNVIGMSPSHYRNLFIRKNSRRSPRA